MKLSFQVVFLFVMGSLVFAQDSALLQKANAGDPAAQVKMGNIYALGKGVPRSSPEAVKWFRKAVEQNHPDAESNLGSMYLVGRGTTRDEGQATQLIQKAAAQGNDLAQSKLALLDDARNLMRWRTVFLIVLATAAAALIAFIAKVTLRNRLGYARAIGR